MRNRIFKSLILVALVVCAAVLSAQEADPGSIELVSIDYQIKGVTRRPALERFLGLQKGKVFPDEAALAAYAKATEHTIINNRVFDPSSTVTYRIETDADGKRMAFLTVKIVGSFSAVGIPIPKYSSTNGFSLAVRYKDYNFLGGLQYMTFSLDYYSSSGDTEIGANGSIPFDLFGGLWTFTSDVDVLFKGDGNIHNDSTVKLAALYPLDRDGFSWFFSPYVYYDGDTNEDVTYGGLGGTVGIKYNLLLPWTLSTSVSYVVKDYKGDYYKYLSNGLSLDTSVPLFRIGSLGMLTFTPSTTLYVNTLFPNPSLHETGWTSTGALSVGKVDWYGNFREGISVSASGTYTKRFLHGTDTDDWDGYLALDASAFTVWKDLIGINARLRGRWYMDWTWLGTSYSSYDWDDDFRGKAGTLYGDVGMVLNLEFPVNVAQGKFFGRDFLTAEVFVTPFLDSGFVRANPTQKFSLQDDGIMDIGCEFTVFPTKARAFAYRLSLGYDLLDLIETHDFSIGNLEIFLGLGTLF